MTVIQLQRAEPLLGYALLHLILLIYLTGLFPKLLNTYLLLAPVDVRLFASCDYSRTHIASHLQNGQYQNCRQMSAL